MEDAAKTMVQTFVISRLDYCNALCYGVTDELTRCLQSVQNAATRLLTGNRRCKHLSCTPPAALASRAAVRHVQNSNSHQPVLGQHNLYGQVYCPGYLADDCQLVADTHVRQLRSADTRILIVSRTCCSFGDRNFAAAGPQVWNSLLPNLRLCGLSYGHFRH